MLFDVVDRGPFCQLAKKVVIGIWSTWDEPPCRRPAQHDRVRQMFAEGDLVERPGRGTNEFDPRVHGD